ncbi:MAG: Tn7 transposase TnsA N-terminal domain-containing protein [Burkholderiaceae bacterium]|nr:Tn7 transposase TnsA N-terminal domain-containing protein [Burkholderiaceae bacterium]
MLTTIYRPDGKISVLAGPLSSRCLIAEGRPTVHPRGQVMTLSRLHRAIAEGCGQGFGESYWPWIRVRRMTKGAVSNLNVFANPLYARSMHLLSGLEVSATIVALWLGASHAREQFPLWPEAHVHPAVNPESSKSVQHQYVPGLLDIAEQAKIKHGNYPGTDIPYVATADLLLQPPSDRVGKLTLVPVKPASEIAREGRKGDRVRERLELQRRYANAIDARYVEFTEAFGSPLLFSQLRCFSPGFSELARLRSSDQLHHFAAHFNSLQSELVISKCRQVVMQRIGISDVQLSHSLFRTATWLGMINLDYRKPIQMNSPIRLDSSGYKASLADQLFGPKTS